MFDSDTEDGMIRVTVSHNGELVETQVQKDSTVQALFEGGHLRGITTTTAAYRVNGKPASMDTPLSNGDRVNTVPTGGRLA
jgi:hypothetical protein